MIPSWHDVLTKIPRLEDGDWLAMGVLKRWFVATRAAVFVMTLFSALIGIILAIPNAHFDVVNALLVCIGLVLAHATNNLVNDWTDFKKGVDKDNYFRTQYGPQPLESGLLSERQLFGYIALTGGLAILVGIALIVRTDVQTLYWMLAGAFFVLFYTWPLKYIGLGEPAVWIVWGPLMVLASSLVVSGEYSTTAIWVSCLYGIGPTTVVFGKHIDKLKEDTAKGVRTLPVQLGEKFSRASVLGLWLIQYVGVTAGVLLGALHWAYLIIWLALPKFFEAWRRYRQVRPDTCPDDWSPQAWPLYLVHVAFLYNKRFSSLMFLGVILSVVLPSFF